MQPLHPDADAYLLQAVPCSGGRSSPGAALRNLHSPLDQRPARITRRTTLPNVRFGSLADIAARIGDVRFTPTNGHSQCLHQSLLSANSRPHDRADSLAELLAVTRRPARLESAPHFAPHSYRRLGFGRIRRPSGSISTPRAAKASDCQLGPSCDGGVLTLLQGVQKVAILRLPTGIRSRARP